MSVRSPPALRLASVFPAALAKAAFALAALTCTDPGHAASPRKTEAELRSLHRKIDRMTQQVSRDAVQRDRLSSDLRAAELSLGQARGELGRISEEYQEHRARRAALAQDREQQQRALENERAALGAQLRAAYLIGREEPLKLLLNQQNPLRSQRLFSYYGYFGRARADQIALIRAHVQRLDELDAQLAQQQSELAGLKGAQQAQLQQLERARDARQHVLASLTAASQSREQSLQRLKTQQADLERLLGQLNRAFPSHHDRPEMPLDAATAFGRARGQLPWPVSGRVTAHFGSRRAAGVSWEGVVIATERDRPVRAVSGGRVVYADWLPGLGLLVIVDHGEGYLSLYGHNDRLLKAAGDLVAPGEAIAAAGDTGGRASPELYFEIRRDGRPVDPLPWFSRSSPDP
jgi:septal ring factor EnvC (AmiA/AmiB activator)